MQEVFNMSKDKKPNYTKAERDAIKHAGYKNIEEYEIAMMRIRIQLQDDISRGIDSLVSAMMRKAFVIHDVPTEIFAVALKDSLICGLGSAVMTMQTMGEVKDVVTREQVLKEVSALVSSWLVKMYPRDAAGVEEFKERMEGYVKKQAQQREQHKNN
jgi:hypothetical protein